MEGVVPIYSLASCPRPVRQRLDLLREEVEDDRQHHVHDSRRAKHVHACLFGRCAAGCEKKGEGKGKDRGLSRTTRSRTVSAQL